MNTAIALTIRIIAFGIGCFLLLQFIFDCDIHSGIGVASLCCAVALVILAFICVYKPVKDKWMTN